MPGRSEHGPGKLERVIAAQVRHYRTASGLSSAELAARTGLSKAMISKIETASTSCSLTTLQRLADGLKIPVTALFRGADTDRDATFTKDGQGSLTIRSGTQHGHEYRVLGTLKGRSDALEPTLVTLTDACRRFSVVPAPGHRIHLHALGENGLRPRSLRIRHGAGGFTAAGRRGSARAAAARGTPYPVPGDFSEVGGSGSFSAVFPPALRPFHVRQEQPEQERVNRDDSRDEVGPSCDHGLLTAGRTKVRVRSGMPMTIS